MVAHTLGYLMTIERSEGSHAREEWERNVLLTWLDLDEVVPPTAGPLVLFLTMRLPTAREDSE